MSDFTLKTVVTPEVIINDPLSELLRVGARGLIAQAVEAELAMMLWKKIKGFNLLTLVVNNVEFKDGVQVVDQPDKKAA